MQKHVLYILTGIVAAANIMTSFPSYAEETSSAVASTVEAAQESTESSYYTDKDFDTYYHKLIKQYENDTDDKTPLYELIQFIYGKGCSYHQLHEVLEDGYFDNYIQDFKDNGLLEDDYTLPSSVVSKNVKVEFGTASDKFVKEHDGTNLSHDFKDLSLDSVDGIVALLCDNDSNDAYITLPVSLADKKIPAQIMEISAYNMEPLHISFIDDKGNMVYTWTLGGIIMDTGDVDLNVNYKNGQASFDFGQTLPKQAYLTLQTKDTKAGVKYIATDSNGTKTTCTTDDSGCITLPGTTGKADYTVTTGAIANKDSDLKNQDKTPVISNLNIPSAAIIWIAVGILAILAIVFLIIGIKKHRK